MSRDDYKALFIYWSKYLKLSVYCKEIGISYSNLNSFMNKDYPTMSVEKCQELYRAVMNTFIKVA